MVTTEPLRVRLASDYNRTGRAWDEVRPAESGADGAPALDDDPHAREMAEAARQVLVAEAGVRDEDVAVSRWVRQATRPYADFAERVRGAGAIEPPWHGNAEPSRRTKTEKRVCAPFSRRGSWAIAAHMPHLPVPLA